MASTAAPAGGAHHDPPVPSSPRQQTAMDDASGADLERIDQCSDAHLASPRAGLLLTLRLRPCMHFRGELLLPYCRIAAGQLPPPYRLVRSPTGSLHRSGRCTQGTQPSRVPWATHTPAHRQCRECACSPREPHRRWDRWVLPCCGYFLHGDDNAPGCCACEKRRSSSKSSEEAGALLAKRSSTGQLPN